MTNVFKRISGMFGVPEREVRTTRSTPTHREAMKDQDITAQFNLALNALNTTAETRVTPVEEAAQELVDESEKLKRKLAKEK